MAKEETEKLILEREYIVPLRREWLKTPKYKRAAKAIKALKKFIARHMKVEERDDKKIKLDRCVNEEIWFRGIRKPLAKIKIKAKKFDSGIVKVELVEIPEILKFKIAREKRREEKVEGRKTGEEEKKEEKLEEKVGEAKAEAKAEVKEEKAEEKKEEKKIEEKEKEKAVIEAGLKRAEDKHKEMRHETVMKKQSKHQFRMALQK